MTVMSRSASFLNSLPEMLGKIAEEFFSLLALCDHKSVNVLVNSIMFSLKTCIRSLLVYVIRRWRLLDPRVKTAKLVVVIGIVLKFWRRTRQTQSNTLVDLTRTGLPPCLKQWFERRATTYSVPHWTIRKVFQSQPLPETRPAPGHTHSEAAGARNKSYRLAKAVMTLLALRPYGVQLSKRDLRDAVEGIRVHFWAKDTDILSRRDKLEEDHALLVVDTEHHMDYWPDFLAETRKPTFVFTTIPTLAAGTEDNASFRFLDTNEIYVQVSGGQEYKHELWDYNADAIVATAHDPFLKRMGLKIPVSRTVFMVDTRHVSAHKAIVSLVPTNTWSGIWSWFVPLFLDYSELKRFRPVVKSKTDPGVYHVHFDVRGPENHLVTIARGGDFSAAVLPVARFDLALKNYRNSSAANVWSLASWVQERGSTDETNCNRDTALFLLDYFKHTEGLRPVVSQYRDTGILGYTNNVRHFGDGEEKPSMTSFMNGVDRCFAPARGPHTAKWAALSRVVRLQWKHFNGFSRHHAEIIAEFRDLLMRSRGQVTFEEYEQQLERQTRPAQKAMHENVQNSNGRPNNTSSAFMKSETYDTLKDPRVITPINHVLRVEYSRYIGAFSEKYMKPFPGYGFKTPIEVANHIAACGVDAGMIIEADVSRMDGNTREPTRYELERPLYQAAFRDVDKQTGMSVGELFDKTVGGKTLICHIFEWNALTERKSGAPDTSNGNSLTSYGIWYLTLRLLGFTVEDAWLTVERALVAGDDTLPSITNQLVKAYCLTPQKVTDAYKAAALAFGYNLKVTVHLPGELVGFLGRFYYPWDGNNNSCCDIHRQLRKFHACTRLPVINREQRKAGWKPQRLKALEKATSFLLTDRNTPLIGEWAERIVDYAREENWPELSNVQADPERWWSQFDTTSQFPNEKDDFYDRVLEETYPGFNRELFTTALAGNPLEMPLCVDDQVLVEDKPSYDVIVGDHLYVRGQGGPLSATLHKERYKTTKDDEKRIEDATETNRADCFNQGPRCVAGRTAASLDKTGAKRRMQVPGPKPAAPRVLRQTSQSAPPKPGGDGNTLEPVATGARTCRDSPTQTPRKKTPEKGAGGSRAAVDAAARAVQSAARTRRSGNATRVGKKPRGMTKRN